MATNDILIKTPSSSQMVGTRRYLMPVTPVTTINPGEPVVLGGTRPYAYVVAMATSKPVIRTDYVIGIAQSTGTASGTVDVFPAVPGIQYSIAPKTAATFGLGSTPNQQMYNAMVGYRVTIDLTSGVYTLNSTDGATNGCLVEYVDVTKAQGRAVFSFRSLATDFGTDSS